MNTYPIENVWEKGHYVARITGPHGRYVVDREFLRGTPRKGRGTLEYVPEDIGDLPAWIIRTPETRCGECGRPKATDTELIAAHPHGWEIVATGLTSSDLLAVWTMGPPGEGWTGARCQGCETAPVAEPGDRCDDCTTANEGREKADALAGSKEDPF